MLRFALTLLISAVGVQANPKPSLRGRLPDGRASAPLEVDTVMVSETVVITVSDDSATVVGNYRFRDTSKSSNYRVGEMQSFELPVPIPSGLTEYNDVLAAVRPAVTVQGKSYSSEKQLRYPVGTSLPRGVNLALLTFRVARDGSNEVELEIRYEQPVISRDGREIVYYVPHLPYFEQFAQKMNLRPDSFQIRFEAAGAVILVPSLPDATETKSVVFVAKHNAVLAVEKRQPNKAPEPTTMSVTPPAAQESRRP